MKMKASIDDSYDDINKNFCRRMVKIWRKKSGRILKVDSTEKTTQDKQHKSLDKIKKIV